MIGIVFNPISSAGRSRLAAERIRRGLEGVGSRTELIESARGSADVWLRPRLEPRLADPARAITQLVVAGGDGAVRAVAPEAARAGCALWHAPCGTENLFARAFGMSADPGAIVAAFQAERTRTIDLAIAANQPFAIMASVGFDADVVHDLAARRAGAISHLSYLGPLFRQFSEWNAPELSWSIDGEHEQLGRGLVVVGNLPDYGLRLNPAADAVPDDGLLDAVFLPADGPIGLLQWAALARAGLGERNPLAVRGLAIALGLRIRRGRSMVIRADRPIRLQLDGDPAGSGEGATEHMVSVNPLALRVLLPRAAGC